MSRYLNDLPGLTSQRLGELYAAILHATDDPAAMAEVTYFARGGMRIEIHWRQNGLRHHYPANLTREQIDQVLAAGVDEDTVFQNFATLTLDSVRQMRNKLADAEAPEGVVETATLSNTAGAELATMLGAARAREDAPKVVLRDATPDEIAENDEQIPPAGDGTAGDSDGTRPEVPRHP